VESAEKIITTCILGGGVPAKITDLTRHYFGGYYHVRIRVCADVPVSIGAFADAAEHQDAVSRLGSRLLFSRTLEKMAVPGCEIESTLQHLLASFEENMLPYLQRDDFADSFVRNEYRKVLNAGPAKCRNYA
jgi:hypothetical protein